MLDQLYQLLDPVAFNLGPFTVRWYGLGYIVGMALGAIIVVRTARRWQVQLRSDDLLTYVIASALGIIIGGRLGYILFYGEGYYFEHPDKILAFSEGGMSFHGGFIMMCVAIIITTRILKTPFLTLADLLAVAGPIGIFLVRFANFINGELWGAPTDLPWGVNFGGAAGDVMRHPTQLYEACLEGLLLLVVLNVLARRKPPLPQGSYFGLFLLLYGCFRIAVEFVRQPDAQIGYLLSTGWLTMGMVLSTPMVLAGIGLLVYAYRTRRPQASLVSASADESAADAAKSV
ncbi:MAG: prolipoprotein diacylglyceryl transferase [Coriobacteriales bacterium]|jgi:phosphatidylglycerol:prolipoprotein diacylglycerol transferase|nr:prolipoprotein diacylglyceryl transferase [Coriobacteriales bacterium]